MSESTIADLTTAINRLADAIDRLATLPRDGTYRCVRCGVYAATVAEHDPSCPIYSVGGTAS